MKKVALFSLCIILLMSCSKDKRVFTLKDVTLNSFAQSKYPSQNLSIKILDGDDSQTVLRTTGSYPSNQTLPATFAISPSLNLKLYKDPCIVQLWGDSSGLIGSSTVDMDQYKIEFQLDMETKSTDVDFTMAGSWK